MKTRVVVLLGALALAVTIAVSAGPADAAAIHNCGDIAHSGAGIYNVTSRVVSCRYARRFARHAPGRCYSRRCHYRGFTCRTHQLGEELADTRCVRGAAVVRWQSGA